MIVDDEHLQKPTPNGTLGLGRLSAMPGAALSHAISFSRTIFSAGTIADRLLPNVPDIECTISIPRRATLLFVTARRKRTETTPLGG
jgi:hypothetical protein